MKEGHSRIINPQGLLDDRKQAMRVSRQGELIVLEFEKDTGWIAMTRFECLDLIKVLAARVNEMGGVPKDAV